MIDQFEKVKYIGHHDGCKACDVKAPPHPSWKARLGKVAIFIGTGGRHDRTVKIHFDGEDVPVFCYPSHLAKAD